MPDYSPKYNLRVGVYNTSKIENFYRPLTWSLSYGPTPLLWYTSSDKRLYRDYSSGYNLSETGNQFNTITYSTTKNSLPVASFSGSDVFTSASVTTGVNTTRFVVFKPWVYLNDGIGTRNIVENIMFTSTSNWYQSSINIRKTGYIYGVSSYTGDSGSTVISNSVAGTYSNNEWCVVVHKGDAQIAQSSFGKINGRVMSATASLSTDFYQASSNLYTIACRNNTTNGEIAEVIFYNSLLSTPDITSVEDYLKAKWGITY